MYVSLCVCTGLMAVSTGLLLADVAKALETLTSEETKQLIIRFRVPLNVVIDIETEYKTSSSRKTHSIQAWLNRDTEASWGKIVSGLNDLGMIVLAREIATQHGLSVAPAPVDVNQSSHQVTPPVVPSGPPAVGELCPVATPSSPTPSPDRVSQVRDDIEQFDDTISDLMFEARSELCLRESVDPSFLDKFCDRLLGLSVAKKATHTKFFRESEDEILEAKSIRKVFAILKRYCSYRNYEILQHIVKKFCGAALQQKMQDYSQSLERFEKATPVDVYLIAIPDETSVEIENAFSKMVLKINKPASECTLCDLRKLNEAIGSSLCFHSVYIGSVADKCVEVVVRFPSSAVGWVLSAMTPAFMHTHLLSEVAVDGEQLTIFEADSDQLVSGFNAVLSGGVLQLEVFPLKLVDTYVYGYAFFPRVSLNHSSMEN